MKHSRRILNMKATLAYITSLAIVFLSSTGVFAAQLDGVAVELSDPRPSETGVEYNVGFTSGASATTAKCVDIRLDTQTDGLGGVPTGLVTTAATFDTTNTDALATPASWTTDVTTNGRMRLTWATGEAVTAGDFVWDNITNGSTEGTAYYALVNTYDDVACSNEIDNAIAAYVYKDGELVSLTIGPSLTFTCTGIASGQDVWPDGNPGSESTTVASTGTGIDHGETVTTSTNGISAHDLNVSTNAASGYNVYVRHTGQLTSQSAQTIADWTGTNASPTSFPAAGTEAWAYTTDDDDLTQFYGLDLWAGFPTTVGTGGDVVMTGATLTAGTETVRVGHQVGIASSTASGTYTTTIIYTVVATF